MDKRTLKASRLLVDDLWCCIRYNDDGVLEVRRKEELVPESDQERCGTTLVIGEACTAKYMDNVIYPATVVFESDEKEHCIKFKVDEEKQQKLNKAKKQKSNSKSAKLATTEKNQKRKENEKKESTKKKRKTPEKTDEHPSNYNENACENPTSKRKKEIKELEKKQSLAIAKAAQEHAATLFKKMHVTKDIEPAYDKVNVSNSPKNITKDQTPKVDPMDQASPCPPFPDNQTLLATPTDQPLLTSHTSQIRACLQTPSSPSFKDSNAKTTVLQQSREFDPSVLPQGHLQSPFYSPISPFQNALHQPLLPLPNFTYNFPYNQLPNAPGYPSSDFPQVFANLPHFNTDLLKSHGHVTSYSAHNATNIYTETPHNNPTTQSIFTSMSNSNSCSNPESQCSTPLDDSTNFSPSEFMSSSMALIDNTDQTINVDIEHVDSMSDIDNDINFEGTNTDMEPSLNDNQTNIDTSTSSTLEISKKTSQCPDCVKKDKEIADLKLRLYKAGASSSNGEVISKTKTYRPKTRPEIKMGDYVVVQEKSVPPVGFQLLAPGTSIAVKPLWLEEMHATVGKSLNRRNKKALKRNKAVKTSSSGEILKKLMDGFFDPDELAVGGGTTAFNGNAIFESLKLYAIHSLNMDIPAFNECWREKMSSAKQTIKRQKKMNAEQSRNT